MDRRGGSVRQTASVLGGGGNGATTSITVDVPAGAASGWTLAVRVPFWATGKNAVRVNGALLSAAVEPKSYLYIRRVWKAGDTVAVDLPMSFRFEPLSDSRPAFAGVGALFYGPLMLAGLSATDRIHLPGTDAAALGSVIHRAGGDALKFTAVLPPPKGCPANSTTIPLIPFVDVTGVAATVAVPHQETATRNRAPNNKTKRIRLRIFSNNSNFI